MGEGHENPQATRNTAIGFVSGLMLGGLIDTYTGDTGVATIMGMILGSLIGYFGLRRVHWMEYPREELLRMSGAGILFFGVLFGTIYLLDRGVPDTIAPILPFAPLIPGFLLFASIGHALSTLDEFQRRIQVEAIAIGFGIAALTGLTLGLLGLTGITRPSWMLVPVVMTFSWLAGKLWTRWKYR